MQYTEFLEVIVKEVKTKVEKDTKVSIHTVVKNNGVQLDALVMIRECHNTAPNIYLNPYYTQYQMGKSVNEILQEIMLIYNQKEIEKGLDPEYFEDFSKIQGNIIYRLVNYKRNEMILNDLPYIRFVDFAITFYCLVSRDKDGIASFRITNEMAENWKVSAKELFLFAQKNTPKLFPVKITTMEELLSSMFRTEVNGVLDEYEDILEIEDAKKKAEMLVQQVAEDMKRKKKTEMFILTNKMGINGASVVLYPEILRSFSSICKSNLYLLPSSIHEFIIVPKYDGMQKEELTQMVQEVNETQLADEEVLSDHVYEYLRETDSIVW